MRWRSGVLGLAVVAIAAVAGGARAFELGTKDSVAVFSPFAALDVKTGTYQMPVVAWIYEEEKDRVRRVFLKQVELAAGVAEGSDEQRLLRRRVGALLADNERGETLEVTVGATTAVVGTSNEGGYIERTVTLPAEAVRAAQRAEGDRVVLPVRYRTRRASGEVLAPVIPPEGLSIISDIDDTVKITEVLDREATFRNTFTREFRPVPGMAALYQGWAKQGAVFHYVSASPWQLAQFLEPFLQASGFPAGTLHLRPLRLKSPSSVRDFLNEGAADKRRRIEALLRLFPARRFILVGDSGERDPEIYGEVARDFGAQVQRVYIRRVDGARNAPARFTAAFTGLSPATWTVFGDPAAIKTP